MKVLGGILMVPVPGYIKQRVDSVHGYFLVFLGQLIP